ncbi:MAG: hypothetical protein RPU64_04120 [Candidatus Sedimenticola sp. (ex Thyasira tokunagai)]
MMELTDEQRKVVNELTEFPMKFCNAFFFGDPSDESVKVNNGTMTLIKYNNQRYGITNYHVIDKFRKRREEEPNIKLAIGNAEINLEDSLIDEDPKIDLCTFNLEIYKESDFESNGDVPTFFYELDDFSTGSLKEGDFVLLGGFPGVWRERPHSNHLAFDTLSSGSTKVTEFTGKNLRCELALDKCIFTGKHGRDEFPENLGGISGGPAFLHYVTDAGFSQFKLVGVIYEHVPAYDSILIRPISFFDENLCIKK